MWMLRSGRLFLQTYHELAAISLERTEAPNISTNDSVHLQSCHTKLGLEPGE
jgi:hypothetical protein